MSVDYFACANCGEAHSEYDRIYCEKCENELCSCAMPDELAKIYGCWEQVWELITIDDNDDIIPKDNVEDPEQLVIVDTIRRYCLYDSTMYGLELKEQYCPICNKKKENEKDPEYAEYLRLKRKFEC